MILLFKMSLKCSAAVLRSVPTHGGGDGPYGGDGRVGSALLGVSHGALGRECCVNDSTMRTSKVSLNTHR